MVEPMVGPMAVLTERLRAVKSVSRSEMMEIGLEHSLVSMDDLLAATPIQFWGSTRAGALVRRGLHRSTASPIHALGSDCSRV